MTELTADVVVPDGIEPLILARSWLFDGTYLRSPQQAHHVWYPEQPFRATCSQTRNGWWVERGSGLTLERAIAQCQGAQVAPPTVELPQGFGYVWETRPAHDGCPGENCTCGVYGTHDDESIIGTFGQQMSYAPGPRAIYSGFSMGRHSPQGTIVGSLVALWGKVIEGEKGARAEFAYPSGLSVPASLAHNAALEAYGVPIDVVASPQVASPQVASPFWTPKKAVATAIGVNVGCAALNMTRAFGLW